ncbi:Short chain dehydrogenase andI [Lasiodiplodia theobromae]|uniref:Short chain dehydrogenase andI n=1 Tax=Lasiodiplodia theobromae TaxID=45133 RepID=A0A5N5CV99_9PEZI|nr:Short chain dehydrogenase andI [Lasiodiplodia theobromae]
MSVTPGQTLWSNGFNFTERIHRDTYPYINPMNADLSGRAVFITGASRGIGHATALSFARAGASFIGIGARSATELQSLEDDIKSEANKAGRGVPLVFRATLDVTDIASCETAAKGACEAFGGRLDVLINNAGYMDRLAPLMDSEPDDWWRTWEINIRGPYLVTRAFLPLMLATPSGWKTVVSLSSLGAHTLSAGGTAYNVSKLALLRFSEMLNVEYGAQGVLAFCVNPGGIETDLSRTLDEATAKVYLTDSIELPADSIVFLVQERREWLAGRYVSCTWDMEDLLAKQTSIVEQDLLKVRMAV